MTLLLIVLIAALVTHIVCAARAITLIETPERQRPWLKPWRISAQVVAITVVAMVGIALVELFAPRALDILTGWV